MLLALCQVPSGLELSSSASPELLSQSLHRNCGLLAFPGWTRVSNGCNETFHPSMIAKIDIHKESLHFACAHFTIFSSDRRENLHGHNYFVRATVSGPIDSGGLCFDYNVLKNEIELICNTLDETTLLASESPHLNFESDNDYVTVIFGDERLLFLKRDVKLLPIRNVTVEELARWFLGQLTGCDAFRELAISEFVLTISSGPSQSASVSWAAK